MRKNPSVTSNIEKLAVDNKYSLGSDDFMMAFAMSKFAGEILQYDPRYVRWVARSWNSVGNERVETFEPLHHCTEEELNKFYDPDDE